MHNNAVAVGKKKKHLSTAVITTILFTFVTLLGKAC